MKRTDVVIESFEEYALVDSGEGRKLEFFSGVVTDRPDPQALWNKEKGPEQWAEANATFIWRENKDKWSREENIPEHWVFSYKKIKLELSFPTFKHVGVFPEHRPQWDEIIITGELFPGVRMLNLFGYTGAASIAGALSGMKVTHVDASKTTITTLKKNIQLSALPSDSVRTICEDALKYTKKLAEKGEVFDVVLLDPPAFGRGPKGEIWKIEESLMELVSLIPKILSKEPKLVILNGYASGYSARTFGELLGSILPEGGVSYGDIGIQEKGTGRILTTGIYAKWTK